jgi:hypothetical protein
VNRIRVFWLIPILVSGCPQQLGNRCGPDLPPCPSGTACVDAVCQEEAAGGGGSVGGGSVGGGSVGGGSVGGGSVGGGSVGGGSVGGSVGGGSVGGGSVGGGSVGGSVGGGSVGGGSAGGVIGCVPACAEFDECVGSTCLRRYFGITVVAPARANQPFPVFASLVSVPGRSTNPPSRLEFEASLSGGTPVRVTDTLSPLPDGGYVSASALPTPREGTWSVSVSWADGGPSGTAQTVVDLSGPRLVVTWPTAPVRVAVAGGLDFRDPLDAPSGPFSWRRHDVVPVRLESSSADVQASTIDLTVANVRWSGQLAGCGPDGGVTDGGFCRIANVALVESPVQGLRGTIPVAAFVQDDLGNSTTVDAGVLSVSRWLFSYDGGSANNGFSVSRAGWLVIPNTALSQISVVASNGSPIGSVVTRQPPVRNAAIGQQTPEFLYSLEVNSAGRSAGAAYDLAQLTDTVWAADETRRRVQRSGPILVSRSGTDSVAAAFELAGGVAASWAVFSSAGIQSSGLSAVGPSLAADAGASPFGLGVGVVGVAGVLTVTDGRSFFSLAGPTMRSFGQLAPDTKAQQTPSNITPINHLIGMTTEVAGTTLSSGVPSLFTADFTRMTFTPWDVPAPGAMSEPIAGGASMYFVRDAGVSSFVCRIQRAAGSTTCVQAQGWTSGIALGAGDTLYAVVARPPMNASFLQVRTASTLALRYEIPLTGVTGACLSLTPTCIGGNPVIGCVDTVGRIVFVSTDARGIDTSADWPMEGHDPAKTFNSATDLTQYSCP